MPSLKYSCLAINAGWEYEEEAGTEGGGEDDADGDGDVVQEVVEAGLDVAGGQLLLPGRPNLLQVQGAQYNIWNSQIMKGME